MTSQTPPKSLLWRHADFRRLWAAQTVSDFGARITREGLPMMAVVGLSASPWQLGVLYAISSGPGLVVGLTAGGFVDRTARRPILIAADVARALVLLSLPLAAWLGLLGMPQVYVAAALVAGASALFDIADHAYLPGLVGKALVTDANARISATESLAEMGGPALAGVLFQWLTAPIAVAVNAVTYVISAIFLFSIRTPEPPRDTGGPHRGWRHGMLAGAAAAWRERRVRPMLLTAAASGLFGGFFGALYVPFALRGLGLSPALLGLAIAAGGASALAGSLMAQPMARWLGVGPAICISGGLAALGALIIPLSPAGPIGGTVGLVVSQLLGDGFGVVSLVLAGSLRQTVLPQGVLGRVGATFGAVGGGAAVVGSLVGGGLAEIVGMRPILLVGAAGLLAAPLISAFSPLWKVREMPTGEAI